MLMPQRLECHLARNHVTYSRILHAPAYSAQVAASLMHIPGREVAKTVALASRSGALLAILPASYRVNIEKLSASVGEKLQLMTEPTWREIFPDCESAAIPSFGELYDVPVYMDQALADDPQIVFGAGTPSESLRIASLDFIRLVKPKICSFAESDLDVPKLREPRETPA